MAAFIFFLTPIIYFPVILPCHTDLGVRSAMG